MHRLGLVALMVAGCGESSSGEVSMVTFNAGLAPFALDYAVERVEPVATAVAEADADVICLQELWKTEDLDVIVAAGSYDTVVRHPDAETTNSCSILQLDAADRCAMEHCPDLCGFELLSCFNSFCPEAVPTGGCLNCAMGTMNGCLDEIRTECEGTEGGDLLFSGYDTAILTRIPTLATDTRALSATLVPTAVSFARVDSEAGLVDVYCAHFASPTGGIEYAGPHGSWEGERDVQIQETLAYMAERSDGTSRIVLMGDLNELVDAEGLAPFTSAGLRSAAEVGEPGCTLCTDSLLVDRLTDKRLDHVYLGDRLSTESFEVIFDQPVTIDTADGPVETHLSDHYGLRAVLRN